ncbi:hypothetical protein CLAIMM_03514 [Cladophialophora immunda]|nr:hypothetical protein CLAIMM_03514 [Cladophialophora immunda]
MSEILDSDFLQHLIDIHSIGCGEKSRLKWYLTAIIALGGMKYAELIPELYKIVLDKYIADEDQMVETRKIREALTKVCGIWGAATTGTAIRQLLNATPEHLQESKCYRAGETHEMATQRGQEMIDSIYPKIPGYDLSLNAKGSADYTWIVTILFYGHVFSFMGILNKVETAQSIVAALLSTDCQEQARNHMMGMQFNGGTREEVQGVRAVVMAIAERLGVRGKQGRTAVEVPSID